MDTSGPLVLSQLSVNTQVRIRTKSTGNTISQSVLKIKRSGIFPEVSIVEIDGLEVQGGVVVLFGSCATFDKTDVREGIIAVGERVVVSKGDATTDQLPPPHQLAFLTNSAVNSISITARSS